MIRHLFKIRESNLYILFSVECFHRSFTALRALLVVIKNILLLNMRRIEQQYLCKVVGSRSAIDLSAVTILNKFWNQTAVIDMSMREQKEINLRRVESPVAVEC